MEENDRLQKQVSQLVYENSYFRQQTQNVRAFLHEFNILADLKNMINESFLLVGNTTIVHIICSSCRRP